MLNKTDKLVSVIILMYCHFEFLKETIQSICDQDYPNIEIIISDDASKNFVRSEIEAIINTIIVPNGVTIKIRQNTQNMGIVAHANLVASLCSGSYIKFLPPGDQFCTHEALRVLIETLDAQNTQVVTSPSWVYNQDSGDICYQYPSKRRAGLLQNRTPYELFSILSESNIISAIGTLYKRDFFENGGFDISYRYLDDWPTWLRLYRNGCKIAVVYEPTTYYSIGGISNKAGSAFESDILRDDLILCYEKEILPFVGQFPAKTRWFIEYRYGILKNNCSVWFKLKFFPADLYCNLKRFIKKLVLRKGI